MIQTIEDCDFYDEVSFQDLVNSSTTVNFSQMNFSIIHQNVRSIVNKYDDFVSFLASLNYEFSVIGITEAWLTKDNLNDFPIPRYKFVGQTRNNKQGVGVGL